MGVSPVSYMVRATTEQACRLELDRICDLLGAVPTILPTDRHGAGWIARAVPMPEAPAGREGLVEL